MPAIVISLAFRSIVQSGVDIRLAIEKEEAAAVTLAAAGLRLKKTDTDAVLDSNETLCQSLQQLDHQYQHHHNNRRRGVSRDGLLLNGGEALPNSVFGQQQQQQQQQQDVAVKPPSLGILSSASKSVFWWGDGKLNDSTQASVLAADLLDTRESGNHPLSASEYPSSSSSSPSSSSAATSLLISYNQEILLWIDAIRSFYQDTATIHSIKHADAEWFKEYKSDLEAQDRKELMTIGIPMKKSWSGGGLGKRQSEFGSGLRDLLVAIGGGGGGGIGTGGSGRQAARVKALGTRTVGRPGRFLEIVQDMLNRLELMAASNRGGRK
ncbi:hypothetical protein BDR26DRAFT_869809 [Obelidium mucronatum]|nr:hypothetical protein BDR26DRAFT_869809 [Obelidium mucronatum]